MGSPTSHLQVQVRGRRAGVLAATVLVLLLALGISLSGAVPALAKSGWQAQSSGTSDSIVGVDFISPDVGWAVTSGSEQILHTTDGGGHWQVQAQLGAEVGFWPYLTGLSFVDASHGWVTEICIETGGGIYGTADGGQRWSGQAGGNLSSVDFIDARNGWAVDTYGAVIHTADGGDHWSTQRDLTGWLDYGESYTCVSFIDASHGWVVGSSESYLSGAGPFGLVLFTPDGGATWSTGTLPDGIATLYSVDFADVSHGWAVGSGGTILASADGGRNWSRQSSGVYSDLHSVEFVDGHRGWAVGNGGVVLETATSGQSWTRQQDPDTTNDLYSVSFPDASHGWAVGANGTIIAFHGQLAFSPNPNGWRFVNEGVEDSQVLDVFKHLYGEPLFLGNGSDARRQAEKWVKDSLRGGVCFGLAGSALAAYEGSLSPAQWQSGAHSLWDLGDYGVSPLWPDLSAYKNKLPASMLSAIEEYFLAKYSLPVANRLNSVARAPKEGYLARLRTFVLNLEQALRQQPVVLGMYGRAGLLGGMKGHAVVAYGLQWKDNSSGASILIYDNNHPGEACTVDVSLLGEGDWSYPDLFGSFGQGTDLSYIGLGDLQSVVDAPPGSVKTYLGTAVSKAASVEFAGSQGNTTGHGPDGYHFDDPDIRPDTLWSGLGQEPSFDMYRVKPGSTVSFRLAQLATEDALAFGAGLDGSYNVTLKGEGAAAAEVMTVPNGDDVTVSGLIGGNAQITVGDEESSAGASFASSGLAASSQSANNNSCRLALDSVGGVVLERNNLFVSDVVVDCQGAELSLTGIPEAAAVRIDLNTYSTSTGTISVQVDQDGNGVFDRSTQCKAAPIETKGFSDISSSPYKTAIESLAGAGIINGLPDGTFHPDAQVTRQQFAKMVVLALGLPVSANDTYPFSDVQKGGYASDPLFPDKYIAVCAANGIAKGTSPGHFSPGSTMSRAQMITMVSRAAQTLAASSSAVQAAGLANPPDSYTPPFGDFSSVHYPWARLAAYNGLLDGLQGIGPTYDFWAMATRGEVAQILYNLRGLTPRSNSFDVTVDATDPDGAFVARVVQGGRISFSTTGQWQMGGGVFVGADGDNYPGPGEQDALVPNARFGALLAAVHKADGSVTYVVLGSSGSVVLPVGGDLYLVFNDRPDYYGDNSGTMRVTGTITEGLASVAGTISGTVTDHLHGQPIVGLAVWAVASSGGWVGTEPVVTDANGNYCISGLSPSSYRVITYDSLRTCQGYIPQWYGGIDYQTDPSGTNATRVDVSSSGATGIDFALTMGRSISGTVKDVSNGDPVSFVEVDAIDSAGHLGGQYGITDMDGNYIVTGLLPGSYKVRTGGAESRGYLDAWYPNIRVEDDPSGSRATSVAVTSRDAGGIDLNLPKD